MAQAGSGTDTATSAAATVAMLSICIAAAGIVAMVAVAEWDGDSRGAPHAQRSMGLQRLLITLQLTRRPRQLLSLA
jgi:hypothetical protein